MKKNCRTNFIFFVVGEYMYTSVMHGWGPVPSPTMKPNIVRGDLGGRCLYSGDFGLSPGWESIQIYYC